jgi:methylmalonyl-CoA/ethylmalonyl-CoA epimerase
MSLNRSSAQNKYLPMKKPSALLTLAQVAWVVKDLEITKRFFQDSMDLKFSEAGIIRAMDFQATYYGERSDGESLVAIAFTGETFIEIIQPLSGKSIFQDFLNENPAGGIQHIAYSMPIAELDKVISGYEGRGLSIVSTFDHPIARIVFFDTRKEIGVMTEVMGITKDGEKAVEQMKGNN